MFHSHGTDNNLYVFWKHEMPMSNSSRIMGMQHECFITYPRNNNSEKPINFTNELHNGGKINLIRTISHINFVDSLSQWSYFYSRIAMLFDKIAMYESLRILDRTIWSRTLIFTIFKDRKILGVALTHISLAPFLKDIGKQCIPRSDAAFCGI